MFFERIGISYDLLKTKIDANDPFYSEDNNGYTIYVIHPVDFAGSEPPIVAVCKLSKSSDKQDVIHFEATYKGLITKVATIDEAIGTKFL